MRNFEYHLASDVKAAEALLKAKDDGKLMAGGMTLLPTLKQRLAAPSDVIDLGGVAALKGIRKDGDAIVIGAMTRHYDVANSDVVKAAIPALAALAGQIGDPAVRHRGTIGGSLANSDPAADYPGGCMGLGATIVTTKRQIKADDYFLGLFETALESDEIITEVRFPVPQKAAYMKFLQPASRFALTGVFVAKFADGVRVAVTGASEGGVFRWSEAEAALSGDFSARAIEGLSVDADGMIGDLHGTPAYRAHLVKVMTKRAVEAA